MKTFCGLLLAGILLLGGLATAEEGRLLRFPDVSKDKIAFAYAGDIYIAPRTGGQAMRLTSHPGLELFPKFSPDGRYLAFSGQYDGDMSVFTVPITGGEPKRLSYHPGIVGMAERNAFDNIVMGWSRDGKSVLFRGRKESQDAWDGRAYLVPMEGGMAEPLPMGVAGYTSFSPDGKKVAYCPIFRDFRTWKRYKGGMAQDVWIFDLTTYENKKITDWVGTDNMPMWYQDRIYFNSDRTGTLNLYCYDQKTGQTRQVTTFTDFDVRWPSLGPDAIAFENGGYVYVMDLPSETMHKVAVEMTIDLPAMRSEFVKVSDKATDGEISPDGKRAVFSARGEIFTVPAKDGNTRNLTKSSGANDKQPVWSPDGKWIAYISDESGEEEIYLIDQDGANKTRLTTDGHCRRYNMEWSPDSKKLVFSDKDLKLYYVEVDTKKTVQIDKAKYSEFRNYSWSPDSRYVAYLKDIDNRMTTIFVYCFDDGTIHQMTPGTTNDYSPAFDPDGKYLYFLSERNFNPLLGSYEFQYVNSGISNLYLTLLTKDEKSPFAPTSDEVALADTAAKGAEAKEGKGKAEDKKEGAKAKEETPKVKIDFDGIFDRQIAIDVPAGNYGGLSAISGAVFYFSNPIGGLLGPIGQGETILHKYVIKDKKDTEFASGVTGYALSAKREKMLINREGSYHIVNVGDPKAGFEDNRLDLSRMEMWLDRRAEFAQMFNEAWRLDRDYFYDANMHGVDWPKMREKYQVLVPYVANRFDLTYVIGEMISELSCSHTYVGGGDLPRIAPSGVGLLAVDFAVDRANNRVKIARILEGRNWNEGLRSPLQEPGLAVKAGDYLLAINGQEVTAAIDPYSLTVSTAGKLVTLTVNDKPTKQGAHDITIKPLASETDLRYYNWVERNRAFVDSASGGKVGYIHIPDMDGVGLVRFMEMFYHQLRKEGLIIDVRWNGGGFVSQLVLDRLRQTLASVAVSRNFAPGPFPDNAVMAHMLTLQNEFSVSDGDNFPYYFREYKLGPLMGKRTWGGVVGIRGFRPLSDGGFVTVPEFTEYGREGKWIIEGVGVVPDIEVDNPPDRRARGYDDQLIQAVSYLMKKIKEEPVVLPPYPGPPPKR